MENPKQKPNQKQLETLKEKEISGEGRNLTYEGHNKENDVYSQACPSSAQESRN